MSVLNQFNNQVQSLPFYNQVSGLYEDQVGQRFTTKDPFYEKVPKKDKSELKPGEKMEYDEVRRRPPPNISEQQRKLWKQIIKRAWYHDRNLCGCMPIDLGCGMISVVSIFPLIGSAIAYKMHYKIIKMCNQAGCPKKIQAEMIGNIGLDFLMTLVPLLGVLLSWMKASSTRNAALFDTWLREQSAEKDAMASRQNQQLASLQRTGEPSKPAPSATRAPSTQPQRQQQRQGTQSRAVNSPYGPPKSNAPYGPPKGASRAGNPPTVTGASRPANRSQSSTQSRPPGSQAPRAQNQPQKAQGYPPRAQPPRAQPPLQGQPPRAPGAQGPPPPRSQGQPQPAQRQAAGSTPSYYGAPVQQPYGYPSHQPRAAPAGAPPVPPKVPTESPRRIPPAGSSFVTHDASPYGPPRPSQSPSYRPSKPSPYGPPRAAPSGGSPYGSPYGAPSPYGPANSAAAAAASQSYMQAPSQYGQSYRPQPPAHQQKYFMQPAVRAHPEVVQR